MIGVIAATAFFIGAVSPSFIDWQQSDDRQRKQIVGYYVLVLGVIVVGAMSRHR